MHSGSIRSPAIYKDKRILLIGSSFSARDVLIQALKFGAAKVILSHRKPAEETLFYLPKGVTGKMGKVYFEGNAACFEDGTKEEVSLFSHLRKCCN